MRLEQREMLEHTCVCGGSRAGRTYLPRQTIWEADVEEHVEHHWSMQPSGLSVAAQL